MENFCPLCAKRGIRRRIKAFQINLEEAVWSCESEEVNNLLVSSFFFFLHFPHILYVLTVLFVFQCSWPIGYEEMTFFHRPATFCNLEEPREPIRENTNVLMELSLYTPPVTPGEDLSKESTEIANTEYSESINSTEESRSVMNKQIMDVNTFKTLPKIVNIKKTNFNITIVPNAPEHCDDRKMQEHGQSQFDTTIMDTFKNFDIPDSMYTEFDLNIHYKTGDNQSESGKLQSDATVSGVETNFGTKTSLSEPMTTLVDIDSTNSLNAANKSTGNISDINALLEIFNSENHVDLTDSENPVDLNDDWLNLFMS